MSMRSLAISILLLTVGCGTVWRQSHSMAALQSNPTPSTDFPEWAGESDYALMYFHFRDRQQELGIESGLMRYIQKAMLSSESARSTLRKLGAIPGKPGKISLVFIPHFATHSDVQLLKKIAFSIAAPDPADDLRISACLGLIELVYIPTIDAWAEDLPSDDVKPEDRLAKYQAQAMRAAGIIEAAEPGASPYCILLRRIGDAIRSDKEILNNSDVLICTIQCIERMRHVSSEANVIREILSFVNILRDLSVDSPSVAQTCATTLGFLGASPATYSAFSTGYSRERFVQFASSLDAWYRQSSRYDKFEFAVRAVIENGIAIRPNRDLDYGLIRQAFENGNGFSQYRCAALLRMLQPSFDLPLPTTTDKELEEIFKLDKSGKTREMHQAVLDQYAAKLRFLEASHFWMKTPLARDAK